MKICSLCKESKNFDEFTKDKFGKFGCKSKCKPCRAKEATQYRLNNPDTIKKTRQKSDQKNSENIQLRQKQYRENHKEQLVSNWQSYYLINRETLLAKDAQYRQMFPERAYVRNANNRHKRRAQIRDDSISIQDWIGLCEKYDNRCLACGKEEITMDHVIPLSKNGRHLINNVQPLCRSCNSSKHTKSIDYRKEVNV